jgi:ligand-binding SRPBCC domain-containing protein
MAVPQKTKTVEFRTVVPGTAAQVMAFYSDPKAPVILTPPPIFFQIRDDRRTAIDQGEIDFTLWFTLLPFKWTSRHEPGEIPTSFIDRMLSGPTAVWIHHHIARDLPDKPGHVELVDRLELAHKGGLIGVFTRLAFDGLPLRFLFFYRHLRTRGVLKRYPAAQTAKA